MTTTGVVRHQRLNVPKVKLNNWCELVNNRTVLSNAILPFKISKINSYSFIVVINLKLLPLCQQLYTGQTCSPDLCTYQSVQFGCKGTMAKNCIPA